MTQHAAPEDAAKILEMGASASASPSVPGVRSKVSEEDSVEEAEVVIEDLRAEKRVEEEVEDSGEEVTDESEEIEVKK